MSSFPVSDNVAAMKGSSTLIAAQMAGEMRAQGIDVIDMSVGEPDFFVYFIEEHDQAPQWRPIDNDVIAGRGLPRNETCR